MAQLQTELNTLAEKLIDDGTEVGIQIAVYVDGELAADIAAGIDAKANPRPVTSETLFTIYSATKGIVASAIHILAERGLIDYEQTVAHYWPDFASEGKSQITVAQALNHLAGIPQFPSVDGVSTEEMFCDLDLAVTEVAKLKPLFQPGTTAVYHGLTIGWIAEALARATDGRGLGEIVRDEIAVPLSIDRELFLGTPETEHHRLATPYDAPPASAQAPELDPLVLKCVPLDEPLADILNRAKVRKAQIPGANVSATARALAKHYAGLVGETDGTRLISEAHLEKVFSHRVDHSDRFMNLVFADPQETPRALAYMLNTHNPKDQSYYGPNARSFGHDGYGGAFGHADADARVAVGYTKTLLCSGLPQQAETASKVAILNTIYENL